MPRKLILILVLSALLLMLAPGVSAQQQSYVVQPGDTLERIGRIYNLSVSCIAQRNGITNPNYIQRGQVIILDFSCPPYGTTGPIGGPTNIYIVQPGDGLNRIAQRFNLDLACIAQRSGIANPNRIFPGQQIILDPTCPPYRGFTLPPIGGPVQPIPPPVGTTYVVQPGDTLGRIGAALRVDPYCVARTNGIVNPNFIFVGQVLTISSACRY